MTVSFIGLLSTALVVTAPAPGRAEEKTPPDYARKPLGAWIEALKDRSNPDLREEARRALGPAGPYAKVAVPALIDAFGHKEPPVAFEAAGALADYGPAVVPK